MKFKRILHIPLVGMAASLWLASVPMPMVAQEPADLVNPFIGASTNTAKAGASHGLGKTFPGAATPYGLTQVSPQTITGGDNGSGYSDEHTTIEGFSMTQMSGVGWYGDLGNFMTMPTTGPLQVQAGTEDGRVGGWRSAYDKATETARAGYYAATLTRYGIRAECTASPHCGYLRFTFPENRQSRIQIDLARRVGGTADEEMVRVVDDHTIEGWMRCTPEGGGWGDGSGQALYTVYFHATFSKPFTHCGYWTADISATQPRHRNDVMSETYRAIVARSKLVSADTLKQLQGTHIGFFSEFPTTAGEQVEMKVGISFVDIEGARRNYQAEAAHMSFAEAETAARTQWNDALGKIRVEGGTEDDRKIFYTALYHTMIDPRLYADVDGRYVGGDYKIHDTGGAFSKRTVFSGWDVFRSQFPLLTLIHPKVVTDMLASLTTLAGESGKGYLERWEFLNAYSGCMIGNPALSVLADAAAKGLTDGYDADKAYQYAVATQQMFGNGPRGYATGDNGLSCTLEYAYTDWCLAQLALRRGEKENAGTFEERSKAYRNLFDKEHGWFRPRRDDSGAWEEWPAEGRLKHGYGTVESNPLQQGWFVPHDVDGMAELMGGRDKACDDLEEMFENTPENYRWNNYYNHANEPVHFVPYLFNRLGRPWLTQKWTRHILRHAYQNRVEGLCGNEDVGQMSAWYVLTAIGIHQACPGDTRYEITSPLFSQVTMRVITPRGEERKFTVRAINNSDENIYIRRIRLNGKPYHKCHIDYADIIAGGTLELVMGNKPCKKWKE